MSKNNSVKVVYKVDHLETTDYKVAASAAKNLCKELNASFVNAALSISQFANWLSSQDSESANFIKSSVLKASDKDGIFAAIREKYPYKDKGGKLVRKVVLCKGLQTIEVITNFDDAILSAIVERTYLRNLSSQILPQYFTIDKGGKITEIDERAAAKMIEADKAAKLANKADKAAKLAKLERIYDELQELAQDAAKVSDKDNKATILASLERFIELSRS